MTGPASDAARVADPGPEILATVTLNVGAHPIAATVLRFGDGTIRLRFGDGEDAPLLTRSQVAALRELLARCQQSMLEAQWKIT